MFDALVTKLKLSEKADSYERESDIFESYALNYFGDFCEFLHSREVEKRGQSQNLWPGGGIFEGKLQGVEIAASEI